MINCKPHHLISLVFGLLVLSGGTLIDAKSAMAANNPFTHLQNAVQSGSIKGWKDVQSVKDLSLMYVALQTRQEVGYKTLQGLVSRHPNWPEMYKVRKLVELKMPKDARPYDVEEWFQKYPPVTGEGLQIYLSALKKMGHKQQLRTALTKAWPKIELSSTETISLITKYKHILTEQQNRKRLDSLFWKKRFKESEYMQRFVSKDYQKLTDARMRLMRQRNGVDQAVRAVPQSLQNDSGLQYARVYWRRKKDMDTGATKLLHPDMRPKTIEYSKKWWTERHILARRAMEDKEYRKAYNLVSVHWQTGGSFPYAQAEFLSGFLALRFLNKPRRAFDHFHKLYKNVKTPVSLSRAAYWLGRSAETLKQPTVARQWYLAAAKYPTTFYGQHALEKLDSIDVRRLLKTAPPAINQAAMDKFAQTENMRMLRLLLTAGLDDYARPFFQRALSSAKSASDYMAIVNLGEETKQRHFKVFASKKILSKDKKIVFEKGYPVLPKSWQPRRNRQDLTLMHAIIRQESNFEITVRSPAGALGLMQLMPGTAGDTRRKLGIKRPKNGAGALTTDPAYNVLLGSTYLQQMLNRFDGSAVMASAAYNAGPARVSRWINEMGDPRGHGSHAIIDWIERMPIYETRNYVQRVLENRFVYTHRLSSGATDVKLSQLF